MGEFADLGDVQGKRVLVRSDLNVPLEGTSPDEKRITDDGRIRASLPTIRELADAGARVVVMAHLGRPKGAPDPAVVGDAVPVERDVQVAAHQHVAALNALAQQVFEVLDGHPAQSFEPTSLIRSARRLE